MTMLLILSVPWIGLLAPLTSASSLPDHPSMSIPYTSNTLSDMVQKASDMVQRERRTLSNAKILLAKLRGDETWVTPGRMETSYDASIFETKGIYEMILANAPIARSRRSSPSTLGGRTNEELPAPIKSPAMETDGVADDVAHDSVPLAASPDVSQTVASNASATVQLPGEEDQVDDVHLLNGANMSPENKAPSAEVDTNVDHAGSNPIPQASGSATDNGSLGARTRPGQEDKDNGDVLPSIESRQSGDLPMQEDNNKGDEGDEEVKGGSNTPPRRITRAQAQADKVTASTRSASPAQWVAPPIHPLFIIPPAVKPEYDFGLPADEAHETRLMLNLYVQKQEEVCRGARKLYEGLLQADRQRKDVLQWCKAEGHLGEMSDGEDWYDKEEWGLDTDLKKGHVEEEEDTTVQGKKTRGRRA